jgi:hypothetical protein
LSFDAQARAALSRGADAEVCDKMARVWQARPLNLPTYQKYTVI